MSATATATATRVTTPNEQTFKAQLCEPASRESAHEWRERIRAENASGKYLFEMSPGSTPSPAQDKKELRKEGSSSLGYNPLNRTWCTPLVQSPETTRVARTASAIYPK